MNYNHVDRIELSLEDVQNLLAWRDKNEDLIRDYKQVISEGIIAVKSGMDIHFIFLDEVFTKYVVSIDDKPCAEILTERIGGYYRVEDEKFFDYFYKIMGAANSVVGSNEFNKKDFVMDTCTTVISCMAYMEHYKEFVEAKTVVSNKSPSGNAHKKKRKDMRRAAIKLVNKVYMFSNVKENSEKKIFVRHALHWGVRGHQRRLKSGKVVWVKPYEKGSSKEQRQGKTYRI